MPRNEHGVPVTRFFSERGLPLVVCATLTVMGVFPACKDKIFTGLKLTESAHVPPPSPSPQTSISPRASPSPPPAPVFMTLNVETLQPKAWWRSCLWVSVNGNDDKAILVGCNKGENAIQKGYKVPIPVNPSSCNALRFRVDIHHHTDAKKCDEDGECPTVKEPSCKRIHVRPADVPFFVAIDASRLETAGALDPRVEIENPGVREDNGKALATAQRDPTKTKLIRVFFEDQPDAQLAKYNEAIKTGGPEARSKATADYGIDFNDLVFNILAENVAVTVEGSKDIPCTLPQTEPIKPLAAAVPGGCSADLAGKGETVSGQTGGAMPPVLK